MNDAFISYSRQDQEWAQKLRRDLQTRGYQVFLDTERLTAGDVWDNQLGRAIRDSRHLIVIWSNAAAESEWVRTEMAYFELERENDINRRSQVHVNLEGHCKVAAKYQAIDDIQRTAAYYNGIGSLEAGIWSRVVEKVDQAIAVKVAAAAGEHLPTQNTIPRVSRGNAPRSGVDIFLSYQRSDVEKARMLADAFQQEGWSVWWDRRIPPGKTWAEVIENSLEKSRCVVVVWSKTSVNSKWVKKEARFAEKRACLIPILIDPVEPPFEFEHVQAADLTDWKGERTEAFSNLVAELRSRLQIGSSTVVDNAVD